MQSALDFISWQEVINHGKFLIFKTIPLLFAASTITFITSHLIEKIRISNFRSKRRGTAVITGGTSGIGLEFSKLFARDKIDLVLVSNDPKEEVELVRKSLVEKFGVKVICESCNLSKNEDRLATFDRILNQLEVKADYLVNNAGFGMVGELQKLEWNQVNDMIQVNSTAVVHVAHAFVNDAINRKSSLKMITTSSLAGVQPNPLFNVYASTKAFTRLFAMASHVELAKYNITSTALLPGATLTNFVKRSKYDTIGKYTSVAKLTPEEVAACGYYHMMNGHSVAVPGLIYKFLHFLMWISPSDIMMNLFYNQNKPSQ
ncbi:very-long-chain 3-oxoacyl-CoA reductase [Acrasis kona]|uniref:Very-long-chain 3-oxoacyl-CoA reductase n=1 Tax=Acrasis kona TaxID=1008807 RepID=A0AAW2Z1E8_9EUKA